MNESIENLQIAINELAKEFENRQSNLLENFNSKILEMAETGYDEHRRRRLEKRIEELEGKHISQLSFNTAMFERIEELERLARVRPVQTTAGEKVEKL